MLDVFFAVLCFVTCAILADHSTLKQFVCGKNEYLWNHDFNDYQNNFLQAKSESHTLTPPIVKLRAKFVFKNMNKR